MNCVIVLLYFLFVIGCTLSLYFNWRAGKHIDRAIEYTHIANDALNIAIKALHSDMDELEILEQQLEKLKRRSNEQNASHVVR